MTSSSSINQLNPSVKKMKQVRHVFIVTLLLNLLVAFCKIVWGFYSQTLSMIADGFHSLLDGTSNIVGIIGLQVAYKPADKNHPYGHRKFEALSAMLISFFIFSTCFQVIKEALQHLIMGDVSTPHVSWVSYAVMAGTFLINLFVARYEKKKGKELKSHLLQADAEHTQSDIYVTLGVFVSLICIQLGYAWMDLAIALVIAVIVFRAGYQIITLHLGPLVDEAVLSPAEMEPIVLAVPGVLGCHRIRTRGGAEQVFADLHIQVHPNISLRDAHAISHDVEQALMSAFDGVNTEYKIVDVLVHVEEEGDTDAEIGDGHH